MASWGVTDIVIICKSEEEAKLLHNCIKEWVFCDRAESGFGSWWLGNIVLGAEIGDTSDYECRGYIIDVQQHGCDVNIEEETAERPMLGLWKAIVDKYCPGARIDYAGRNEGNGVYITNIIRRTGLYNIDIYEDEILSRVEGCELCDLSRGKATEVLQYALRTSRDDFAELVYEFERLGFGEVYEWKFVPVEEADAY